MPSTASFPNTPTLAVQDGRLGSAEDAKNEDKEMSLSTVTVTPAAGPDVPEGGICAWFAVVGAFLLRFAAGYILAFGVYQDLFTQSFLSKFSASQISWIGSVGTFLTFSAGLFSGRLFDAGYYYFLMIGGCALVTFCLFMLSLAQPQQYYQVFLTLGLGYGIGFGAIYVPTIAVLSHYFNRRRALAMGIATSGTSLGATLHPIMLNNLFHGPVGFANGVRASAALIAGCMLVALSIMRTRLPPRKSVPLLQLLPKFARDKVYMLVMAALFLYVQGIFFPLVYIQLDSDSHNLNPTFGFYSLAIMNMSGFAGCLSSGPLASTLGIMNATIVCAFCGFILIFGMIGVKSIAGVVIISVLFGFFSGAYIALLSPLTASLAGDFSEIGARIGVGYTFVGLGSLIGTPITGALLSHRFIWWRPSVYAGSTTAAGVCVLLAARFFVAKRKGSWKC